MKIRDLIRVVGLATLALKYAEFCWLGWKATMQQKLDNDDHPFLGAPPAGTTVTMTDGTPWTLTAMDRVRINQLTDASLEALGVLEAAQTCRAAGKPKEDVFHPEFVGTFADLRALSHTFLLNNLVPTVNLFVWVSDQYASDDTTVEEFCAFAKRLLAKQEPGNAKSLNLSVRHGWLARVVVQNAFEGNKDFVPSHDLTTDVYDVDPYVVNPVIQTFAADLENSAFDCMKK